MQGNASIQRNLTAWGFVLPCLLGLLVLTYGPTVASFSLSFTHWNLLGTPQWAGLANYQSLLLDPLFWRVLGNTVVFVAVVTAGETLLALALAWWVFGRVRGQRWFRTVFFLPVVAPLVSVALVWGWLYNPEQGLMNAVLQQAGVLSFFNNGQPVAWLYNPRTAMAAIMVLQIWKNTGYAFLILLAGLQALDTDLLEAAILDGAPVWQRFFSIVLPLLSPTLFFVVTVSMINNFQAFDSIYLLTQGGPQHSTEVLVHWLFGQAFTEFTVGRASALAYCLFVIILGLTLLQWWGRTRWVEGETGN